MLKFATSISTLDILAHTHSHTDGSVFITSTADTGGNKGIKTILNAEMIVVDL